NTQLDYWRQALAGLPDRLQLPTDRPYPAETSHRGGAVPLVIDARIRETVEQFARREKVTVSMVLQSALAVLLHQLGGGADIPIGSPIAGRSDEALSDLVGFFVNSWVLRANVDPFADFSTLVTQVKEKALAAYTNQDVPFELLVDALNPVRSAAYHPLFQVSIAFQNNAVPTVDLPGVAIEPLPVLTGTARFDLMFNISDAAPGESLLGTVEYAADLFDEASVRTIADRFLRVLDATASAPTIAVGSVELMDTAERTLILHGWNHTTSAAHASASVIDMLEHQVAVSPESVAVRFADQHLTYQELNRRSNRVAYRLIDHGVGPDTVVAVALPRSVELVVGLLAVLKAGGAYLPLDPAYPAERLAFMLTDSEPIAVLTDEVVTDTLPNTGVRMLDIYELGQGAPDTDPHVVVHPGNLAYLIYTSGTTGQPKAVLGTQAALANRIAWAADSWPGEVRVAKSSASFIDGTTEILGGLIAGAVVVVADSATARDAVALANLAREATATQLLVVPTVVTELAELAEDRFRGIQRWICSGEALPQAAVATLRTMSPGAVIVNSYGSSEVAGDVLVTEVGDGSAVTLGRPVSNTQVFVLDTGMRVVPVGVTGELYVGGVQVARGYHGRSGLTAS
ncbi:AMP-binding protein, partial [Nocardia sp. 2]